MERKELMIGDWVYIKEYPMRQEAKKMRAEHYQRSLCEFEPIPLTEWILKANGAYAANDRRSVIIDCFCYGVKDEVLLAKYNGAYELSVLTCVDSTGEPNEVYDLPCVKYVHELQHALRLCGLNEIADNFKV